MTKIKIFLLVLGGIVVLLSLGSAIFFYGKYQQTLKSRQALTEIEEVVRRVSALMELPQGETPTLATVSDKTKLQNQSFFQNAENGDRILVYSQAKRAILYRPSINKIIDVAPIYSLEEAAKQATPSPPAAVRVALYNGSGVTGLTHLAEEKLKEDKEIGEQVQIVTKENAQSQYQGVLVVDLVGNQTKLCQLIAKLLLGTIIPMPAKEKIPDAQILVILGNQ